MAPRSTFAVALVGTLLLAGVARAEGAHGASTFVELGQTAYENEFAATQFGLHFASLTPYRPTFDFALAALVVPGIVAIPDLDLALPIGFGPGVLVVPRAGLSAVVAAFPGGAGGLPAANVGLGLVANLGGPISFRADFTARSFLGDRGFERDVVLHSFTVGIGWHNSSAARKSVPPAPTGPRRGAPPITSW